MVVCFFQSMDQDRFFMMGENTMGVLFLFFSLSFFCSSTFARTSSYYYFSHVGSFDVSFARLSDLGNEYEYEEIL